MGKSPLLSLTKITMKCSNHKLFTCDDNDVNYLTLECR